MWLRNLCLKLLHADGLQPWLISRLLWRHVRVALDGSWSVSFQGQSFRLGRETVTALALYREWLGLPAFSEPRAEHRPLVQVSFHCPFPIPADRIRAVVETQQPEDPQFEQA